MTEEAHGEPTPRARLWIGLVAGLMQAAARDLGPDCPVGSRLAEGAEEAMALLDSPRPPLRLVVSSPGPPARRLAAAEAVSGRRARRRTTSPG